MPKESLHSVDTVKNFILERFHFFAYLVYRPLQFLQWLSLNSKYSTLYYKFYLLTDGGVFDSNMLQDMHSLLWCIDGNNWYVLKELLIKQYELIDFIALFDESIILDFFSSVLDYKTPLEFPRNERLGSDPCSRLIDFSDLGVKAIDYRFKENLTYLKIPTAVDENKLYFELSNNCIMTVDSIRRILSPIEGRYDDIDLFIGGDGGDFLRYINRLADQGDLRACQLHYLLLNAHSDNPGLSQNEYDRRASYLVDCIYIERYEFMRRSAEKLVARLKKDCLIYLKYLVNKLKADHGVFISPITSQVLSQNSEHLSLVAEAMIAKATKLIELRNCLGIRNSSRALDAFVYNYSSENTQNILRINVDNGWGDFFLNIAFTFYYFFRRKYERVGVSSVGFWSRSTDSVYRKKLDEDYKQAKPIRRFV